MSRRRRRWYAAVAAAVAIALTTITAASATPVGTVDYEVVAPGIQLTAIGTDQASAVAGAAVKAGVKLVAGASTTVDTAVIYARDPNGANVDFPATSPYTIGVNQQTFEASRTFTTPGTYTYGFSYLKGGVWTQIGPERSFTITASAPSAPTVISMAASPSPATTADSVTVTTHWWAAAQTVSTAVVACRTSTGGNCDFGHQYNYAFTGADQTFTASHTFTTADTYSLWMAYQDGTGWHNLTPTVSLAVSTGGGTIPDRPMGASAAKNLLFDDEFSGTVVDTSKWSYRSTAEANWCAAPLGTDNPSNKQLEFDQPGNASVSSGTLKLTAKPDNITDCGGRHFNWSSAVLTTRKDTGVVPNQGGGFAQRYMWIEASMKFPAIKGFWPAYWTWNGPSQETDAVEYYSDNKTRIYQTSHTSGGGGCISTITFDPSAAFHVYAADITSAGTDFYIDGVLKCHAAGTPTDVSNLVLDNFVFNDIPPDPGTTGVAEVDWARAWAP